MCFSEPYQAVCKALHTSICSSNHTGAFCELDALGQVIAGDDDSGLGAGWIVLIVLASICVCCCCVVLWGNAMYDWGFLFMTAGGGYRWK